jgi:hypothetical protein
MYKNSVGKILSEFHPPSTLTIYFPKMHLSQTKGECVNLYSVFLKDIAPL